MISHLPRRDVANLRLTSRTFHHIPAHYFKNLIREYMPWFWELKELEADNEKLRAAFPGTFKGGSRSDPNWFQIYMYLRILQLGMLGLRNRVRIYKNIKRLVTRIGRLRSQDPSRKYYLEGSGGQLEFIDPLLAPGDSRHGIRGRHCHRCARNQFEG
jgi:hypothetical protein